MAEDLAACRVEQQDSGRRAVVDGRCRCRHGLDGRHRRGFQRDDTRESTDSRQTSTSHSHDDDDDDDDEVGLAAATSTTQNVQLNDKTAHQLADDAERGGGGGELDLVFRTPICSLSATD